MNQPSLGTIFALNEINYHQDNWLDLLSLVEFAYNTIYFSTQETPLVASHGLHPKFDIQGVNNIPIMKPPLFFLWELAIILKFV